MGFFSFFFLVVFPSIIIGFFCYQFYKMCQHEEEDEIFRNRRHLQHIDSQRRSEIVENLLGSSSAGRKVKKKVKKRAEPEMNVDDYQSFYSGDYSGEERHHRDQPYSDRNKYVLNGVYAGTADYGKQYLQNMLPTSSQSYGDYVNFNG